MHELSRDVAANFSAHVNALKYECPCTCGCVRADTSSSNGGRLLSERQAILPEVRLRACRLPPPPQLQCAMFSCRQVEVWPCYIVPDAREVPRFRCAHGVAAACPAGRRVRQRFALSPDSSHAEHYVTFAMLSLLQSDACACLCMV